MNDGSVNLNTVIDDDVSLALEPIAPGAELDASTTRRAHAVLRARTSGLGRWEARLGAALVASYSAYAVTQIYAIFSHLL